MNEIKCPKCHIPMIKKKSKYKENVYWWGCPNYPKCSYTAVEHPNGFLMSTPANQEVKNLRIQAHKLADKKFKNKKGMYSWLKENTSVGHIGKMDKKDLLSLIDKLRKDGGDEKNFNSVSFM